MDGIYGLVQQLWGGEWTSVTAFATVAATVSFLAHPLYIISMFRGNTVAHPFTWISSALLTGVTLVMFLDSGGTFPGAMMIGDFLGFFFIAIISLFFWKKKNRHFDSLDTFSFIGSLVSIGIYAYFHNPFFAFLATLVSEVLALLPTIRKTYHHPDEEDFVAWTFTFFGDALNIFAIRSLVDFLYVGVIYCIDGLTWAIILGKKEEFLFKKMKNEGCGLEYFLQKKENACIPLGKNQISL